MRVHTVHTYTVAHAPSRADFTRDFTSAVSCRAMGAGAHRHHRLSAVTFEMVDVETQQLA